MRLIGRRKEVRIAPPSGLNFKLMKKDPTTNAVMNKKSKGRIGSK
jgi:hypothetical protein